MIMAQELTKTTKLAWRKILISPQGTEGMLVAREAAPRVNGNGDSHKIVFEAGKAEGYLMALDAIYEIASADKQEKDIEIENK